MDESDVAAPLSRRKLLGYGIGALGASTVGTSFLSACSSSGSAAKSTPTTSVPPTTVETMGGEKLLTAARADGHLTTCAIGEPNSYYEPVIAAFEDFAGFEIDTKNPTYPPTYQVRDLAKAADAGEKPPYDVVEVTQSTANDAAGKGLLEPYVSSLWTEIPSAFKDADGQWSASYYGVVTFITNTQATKGFLPSSWDELATSKKTPKASFSMLGDPRTGQPLAGGLGLLTVMSAAIANGGSVDDVEPGLELLGELVDKGIFDLDDRSSLIALPDVAGSAETPVNALYSFDLPLAQYNAKVNKSTVEAAAPSDGLVAGFYPQAIAAHTEHGAPAKLWLEFLQSDQGAAVFLANGAIPTRANAIAESGSQKLRDALPSKDEMDAPVPSVAQISTAQATIDKKWTKYVPVKD